MTVSQLSESVAKLQSLLSVLKSGDASFAASLIASYKKYGSLTPKQEPWIGKLIAKAEAPAQPVFSAPLAAPAAANVGDFGGVVALFLKAKEHLKFPKVRLVLNGTKIVLSLNGPKSKRPGHVSISGEGQYPYKAFYGTVSPEGVFTPFKQELPGLSALLTQFASHPARVAKDHGKLTGNCCFCNKVLGLGEDKRSVLVGFGPVCAEHYGLKAEWLSGVAKAEAKASVALPANIPTAADVPSFSAEATVLTPSPEQAALVALDTQAQDAELEAEQSQAPSGEAWVATPQSEPVDVVGVTLNGVQGMLPEEVFAVAKEEVVNFLQANFPPVNESTCFFCEQSTVDFKTLHGLTVCANCVSQLV